MGSSDTITCDGVINAFKLNKLCQFTLIFFGWSMNIKKTTSYSHVLKIELLD